MVVFTVAIISFCSIQCFGQTAEKAGGIASDRYFGGKQVEPVRRKAISNFSESVYTNKFGAKYSASRLTDSETDALLKFTIDLPQQLRIELNTSHFLSKPRLLKFYEVLPRMRHPALEKFPSIPQPHKSAVTFKKLGKFNSVGFNRAKGYGVAELLFLGDSWLFLELDEQLGTYHPPSPEQDVVSSQGIAEMLLQVYKIRLVDDHEDELISKLEHRRGNRVRFTEKTYRHEAQGIRKRYRFFDEDKKEIATWYLQEDGSISWIAKNGERQVQLCDNDSDGHYEWLLVEFADRDIAMIDIRNPWEIRLATNEQYQAYCQVLFDGIKDLETLGEKYLEATANQNGQ